MNACCQIAKQGLDKASSRPASRWRCSREIAGWILPSVTLLLLPKCPACVAAYVALIGGGVGISVAAAANLRSALLLLCVAVLLVLAVNGLCRFYRQRLRSNVRY
jgi:hypothetical protein